MATEHRHPIWPDEGTWFEWCCFTHAPPQHPGPLGVRGLLLRALQESPLEFETVGQKRCAVATAEGWTWHYSCCRG
jgi:hypothetical protein